KICELRTNAQIADRQINGCSQQPGTLAEKYITHTKQLASLSVRKRSKGTRNEDRHDNCRRAVLLRFEPPGDQRSNGGQFHICPKWRRKVYYIQNPRTATERSRESKNLGACTHKSHYSCFQ